MYTVGPIDYAPPVTVGTIFGDRVVCYVVIGTIFGDRVVCCSRNYSILGDRVV